MNLNKVMLVGRLTANPELRTTPGGQPVTSFSVATNRSWTDKTTGKRQEEVEFHNIVVWGRQAEIASQFMQKGQMVMVEGRLRTRSWQDKQGGNHRTTEVICERFQFGPRAANAGGGQSVGGGAAAAGSFGAPRRQETAASAGGSPSDVTHTEELPTIELEEEIKPEDIPF